MATSLPQPGSDEAAASSQPTPASPPAGVTAGVTGGVTGGDDPTSGVAPAAPVVTPAQRGPTPVDAVTVVPLVPDVAADTPTPLPAQGGSGSPGRQRRLLPVSDKALMIGSAFFAQTMRIGATLVMARWLTPDDYGAFTLVVAAPAIINSLGDFSLPASMIQLRDHPERAVFDTAMLAGVALYSVYGLITIGCGIYLVYIYDDPRMIWLAVAFAATQILSVAYRLQLAWLSRHLQFSITSRQNFIYAVAQAGSGIAFALGGLGVFALALQAFVGQLVANIAVQWVNPLRLPRQASLAVAKRFVKLGTGVSAAGYLGNVQLQLINLLIAALPVGREGVGYFGRSVNVQQMFAQNLLTSFESVTYPMLCSAINDPPRLRDLFVRAAAVLMLVSVFFAAWLGSASLDVVHVVLGGQWVEAVPPLLTLMALAIPAGALFSVGYNTAFALGRTGWLFRVSLINFFIFLPLAAVLGWWIGLIGAGIAWVVARWIVGVTLFSFGAATIKPPIGLLFRRIGGLLLCGLIAAAAMKGVLWGFPVEAVTRWIESFWPADPSHVLPWLTPAALSDDTLTADAAPLTNDPVFAGVALPSIPVTLVRLLAVSLTGAAVYGLAVLTLQREVLTMTLALVRQRKAGKKA